MLFWEASCSSDMGGETPNIQTEGRLKVPERWRLFTPIFEVEQRRFPVGLACRGLTRDYTGQYDAGDEVGREMYANWKSSLHVC